MDINYKQIKANIEYVFARVNDICIKVGRKREEITILAATKNVQIDLIRFARECGINVFGENRVQELIEKYKFLPDYNWHFIGRLQRNKIKYICDKVSLIHSIDDISQVLELEKRCRNIGRKMDILLEINIGQERSKGGINENQIDSFIHEITKMQYIQLKGFMTIPPFSINCEDSRKYFIKMKYIFEKYKNLNYNNVNIQYLSMGMSNDFEIAIEEGSNIIRIGSKIFGERK